MRSLALLLLIIITTYNNERNITYAYYYHISYMGLVSSLTKSHLVHIPTRVFCICPLYSSSDWWRARSFSKVID